MFNRTLAIQELVDNDFSDIFNLGESEGSMLESILMYGFKGYNNFTDNELMYELEERGILCENLEIELDDISHINE
jgi:hypothetical protein